MYKQLCRRIYGITVISEALALFYKSLGVREDRIYKLPMLIDPSPFIDVKSAEVGEDYIAYCGEMNNNKDGIDDLIEAFSIFSLNVPDIKLYLIGDTSDKSQYESYTGKVLEKKLNDRVVFTGRVPHESMPQYLSNAKILVLARPDNEQAQNGFPSKLGEYLATGNPVVITRTGDIDKYLIDGRDCFFVEPGNPSAFADKLYEVICNYERAMEVGRAGKQKVFHEFNYTVQMRKMIDFFDK
jgi:glycosyltransferase involved in cell wall biosynthesis